MDLDVGRSTADVLFGYRWLAAKTQRVQKSLRVLGIDMSRAFRYYHAHKRIVNIYHESVGETPGPMGHLFRLLAISSELS